MESIRDKKKLLILLVSIISGLAIIVTTVLATVLPRLNSFTSSNKTAVTIEEIWDGSKFNSANVKTLLATLSNNSNGTIDTISSNIDSSSGDVITAAQIRNYTTNKSSGQSVIVTFGGFEWIVTYLSKSKQGDVVATLWLSGEDTLDTSMFGYTENSTYGPDSTSGYPTNMYGTSYIRAKLNNGGRYIKITSNSSNPTSVSETYSPVSNYKFADFVQDGVLTEYMVTPANISWQENGQNAKTTLSWTYNVSNENWSKDTPDTGFYSSGYNYAHKEYSDTWKDDYLWLPSMTETGYNDSYPGMWSLTIAERSDYRNSSSQYSWSRSARGNYSNYANRLDSSGDSYDYKYVDFSLAVRPALHLNLNAVAKEAGLLPTVGELWDSSSEQFNLDNVQSLLNVLSNNASGSIATISQNIDSNGGAISASTIRAYTTGKADGDTVTINLGGFKWQVTYLSKSKKGDIVATLWLSGDEELDTSSFGDSSDYYGTDNPNSGVPTNMYGTSYIRAKLNNGGNYINITSNSSNPTSVSQTYSPVSDYKFAAFVQGGVLTQYMVTPAQISWQENGQSAKDTLGASYNYSNENWTDTKTGATADSNFYGSGSYNYAGKTFSGYGNSTWKDDYLWLPSLTETGYNDSYSGMWDLSVAERSNGTTYSWSRSADYNDSDSACSLRSSGDRNASNYVYDSRAVRPALHLNLSAIISWPRVQVEVSSNSTGGGEVSGGGDNLTIDSQIELTAIPNTGCRLVGWSLNSSGSPIISGSEGMTRYPVTVKGNVTYYAVFQLITYDVTVTTNTGDNSLGQILYNNTLVADTTTDIPENTTLTLYAIPKPNSAFICWQITIGDSTTYDYDNNPLTTTITADTTITAVFSNSLMEGIGVTALGGGQVRMGGYIDDGDPNTTVVLNAICYSGYTFDGWYTMENGVLTKIDALGNSTAVTINVSAYDGKLIIARFVPNSNGNVNDNTNNI